MQQIKVVGLGGSIAPGSRSLAALQTALDGAQEAGAQVELFDLRRLALPLYDPGIAPPPPDAVRLAEAMYQAQGLIWSSPLYHGSMSGAFKNALDWLQLLIDRDPPYLADKIVGLIGTAGGTQGLQAINAMEFVVRALRAWAVPLVIPVSRSRAVFDTQGRLLDHTVAAQLRSLGIEVMRAARRFNDDGVLEYAGELGLMD